MKSSNVLASLSLADLQQELRRRERLVLKLTQRRTKLVRAIAKIEAQIGSSPGRDRNQRGRPRGVTPAKAGALADLLSKLLRGKQMRVNEATQAVRDSGHGSKSSSLRTMVNLQLANPKRFRRVSRGVYTAV